MRFSRLVLISASVCSVMACADQSTKTSVEEDAPEIFAIGRYVLPTNRFWDLYEHVGSNGPGEIKYDSEFRHPHLPVSDLVVDCKLTHRIGVTLAAANPQGNGSRSFSGERYGSSWSKRLKVKYHWSHSTREDIGFSYYVTPSLHSSDYLLSDGITLTKKNRIDGTWTVEVTYKDDTIYQTGFQLVGCPFASP